MIRNLVDRPRKNLCRVNQNHSGQITLFVCVSEDDNRLFVDVVHLKGTQEYTQVLPTGKLAYMLDNNSTWMEQPDWSA